MSNDNEPLFLLMVEINGTVQATSAVVTRLETDVPNLYRMFREVRDSQRAHEKMHSEDSHEQSGRRWVYARITALFGAVFTGGGVGAMIWSWLTGG